MFKRKNRLTAAVKKTFSRSLYSPLFILRIGENGLAYNRYAVIVSKKIDKRAVVRNSIKRIIHACVQEIDRSLKKGYDMLFIVRKNFFAEKSAVCQSTKELLYKEKLLL